MQSQIYTNYRLILPTEEILGTLVVEDGIIADIQPEIVSQGQNGEGNYKEYYQGKHGVPEAKMDEFIQMRLESQRKHAVENRQALVKMTREKGISLASHDDATVDRVTEAIASHVFFDKNQKLCQISQKYNI
ncbi:MAG: hypothetical protein QNJ72_33255 [Pleurocapsa sp. MO_226.B13]|nr:hypothetical protein [Pleurocapsa sp. MO_226.B13]